MKIFRLFMIRPCDFKMFSLGSTNLHGCNCLQVLNEAGKFLMSPFRGRSFGRGKVGILHEDMNRNKVRPSDLIYPHFSIVYLYIYFSHFIVN